MTIKVWDYLKEYTLEREDILAAVDRVFSSGTLILGNSVKSFEEEFSSYCDAKFGIGVDNATNGLFLSLKALNIGPGDEVITVANTAVPTVSAIVQAGATPRFIDVDPKTALMNVELLEGAITEKTRCIIPVHLYGQCVDMLPLLKIAKKHNLKVIEDCSQSHGATQHGKKCGSFGDLGVFSFYPTKTLGGYGDGGLITTNSEAFNEKLRSLRFYGMKGVYYAEEMGYNSRLDEVHAEILRFKLKKLDAAIESRRRLAQIYQGRLSSLDIQLPYESSANRHAYYVYVVKHQERDRIMAELKKENIFLNISYPWPIHTMRGYQYLGGKEGDLPITEALTKTVFSLPMYPTLGEEEVDVVCKELMRSL
jgi:aminotransferase EvaB